MSREIKFRAWSPSNKTMGNPFNLNDELLTNHLADNTDRWLGDTIFMQFTGLLDKNGMEVYEGDIVEGGFEKHRGLIKFGNYANPFGTDQWTGYQCFYIEWDKEHSDMTRGDTNYWLSDSMDTAAVVIGNIYENPDLLKEN